MLQEIIHLDKEIFLAINQGLSNTFFDWLHQNGKIKLKAKHRIPKTDWEIEKGYCKWHGSFTHTTEDCLTFRNMIQDLIESKEIVFPDHNKKNI